MQYLGGKSRTFKDICKFLEGVRKPDQLFLEPFCGALWITQGMSGERIATDANASLISMWQAAKDGYVFPEYIEREVYDKYKACQNQYDPLTAFIGFGYSFGGKWFGGYADKLDPKNHLGCPKKTVSKKIEKCMDVEFSCGDYSSHNPSGCLIYCDPPYAGTTGYGGTSKFDTETFWGKMREWSENNTVVVSEYAAPSDFTCVWEKETKVELRTKNGREGRVEKLFMYKGVTQ